MVAAKIAVFHIFCKKDERKWNDEKEKNNNPLMVWWCSFLGHLSGLPWVCMVLCLSHEWMSGLGGPWLWYQHPTLAINLDSILIRCFFTWNWISKALELASSTYLSESELAILVVVIHVQQLQVHVGHGHGNAEDKKKGGFSQHDVLLTTVKNKFPSATYILKGSLSWSNEVFSLCTVM